MYIYGKIITMSYRHYGNYADVWKHLALCYILTHERPSAYVESNSASASYKLDRAPGQVYGIYHFMERAATTPQLVQSTYYRLQQKALQESRYIGSPGLAMQILGHKASQYLFFDIQREALDHIGLYADSLGLASRTELRQEDSRAGLMNALPNLPPDGLVLVDPYFVDQPGPEGFDYLDVYAACAGRGMGVLLWYGFTSLGEKDRLNELFRKRLSGALQICGAELILAETTRDEGPVNPGIPGNGLLWANVSEATSQALLEYSRQLVDIYDDARFEGRNGALRREIVN